MSYPMVCFRNCYTCLFNDIRDVDVTDVFVRGDDLNVVNGVYPAEVSLQFQIEDHIRVAKNAAPQTHNITLRNQ
jgi:hypothetical protein